MPGYILTYSRTFYNSAGFSAARTATTIPNFCVRCILPPRDQVIIIMYIYHALINALSAHMTHINLNMIFYTHVKHSLTKTIYIKYYLKKNKKNKSAALQTRTHIH